MSFVQITSLLYCNTLDNKTSSVFLGGCLLIAQENVCVDHLVCGRAATLISCLSLSISSLFSALLISLSVCGDLHVLVLIRNTDHLPLKGFHFS